jgi:hypothetical protein
MKAPRILSVIAICSLAQLPLASLAAGSDTFRNGRSIYGDPVSTPAQSRMIDVGTNRSIFVEHGETVTFRSGGKTFVWSFTGLDRRTIELSRIAPVGFPSADLKITIGQDISNRN